ncbi:hypothetical protein CLAIMM_03362 isoform 2 [Cladophialophora immunda]|nr:hypothetical protein CLAIMM_03362 isoform 2 [Cladophialophora immunda]
MDDVVTGGRACTSSDVDYTVKVEATGLQPFTTYFYQFWVCDSQNQSPIGRTKTSPAAHDDVTEIKLAIFSCSNYDFGFFNAYGNVARKDSVDYIIHLGDFIYEYAEGDYGWGWSIGRRPSPETELRTLRDYRTRLSQYRSDKDSLAVFRNFAWIPVWDDHELGDNPYRDGMAHLNNTEQSSSHDDLLSSERIISFDQRKMNAVRAYFEWMPIRQVEMDDNLRIWRSFAMGNLLDLIMLDTRHYDRSITDLYWNTGYIHAISNDVGRSLMGSRQENWFYNQLSASKDRGAAWRLIGNQIVFSHLNQSLRLGDQNPLNYDAWDGYQANRNRTLRHLYDHNITDNIFLAGDSHMSWVSDLAWLDEKFYDPVNGKGAIGVEFAGSAVSSPCPWGQNISRKAADNASTWLVQNNPALQWQDVYYRGYYEMKVTHDAVKAQFLGIPSLVQSLPYEISLANFTVLRGTNALQRPIAGASVRSGALKEGQVIMDGVTNNTLTGEYLVTNLTSFGYSETETGF